MTLAQSDLGFDQLDLGGQTLQLTAWLIGYRFGLSEKTLRFVITAKTPQDITAIH